MEDEIPSTKHLVLKPKEIVPVDGPARPGDGQALSVQLIHHQNRLAEEKAAHRRKEGAAFPEHESGPALPPIFKPKEIDPVDAPSRPGDEEAIRVQELLLQNRIAEEQSDWKRFEARKKRRSKRTRDFLLWVGSFDLAVLAYIAVMRDEVSTIFGLSVIALLTSMVAWIMFFVMDDY